MLDRFFTVLTITSSFLVCFWPVKCKIEALIILFRVVRERSVRFSFWSGQWSGQTLVKLGRIWSKLSKLLEIYPGLYFEGFWARWVLVGLETARSNLGQTSVNPSQTWSNLGECVLDLLHRSIFTHRIFSGVGTQNGTARAEPA